MSAAIKDLEQRSVSALMRHLEQDDERTRNEAYEFGRTALADGVGVLDMALLLWRATLAARGGEAGSGDAAADHRRECFLLECLSPFEMAHRGTREANQALRRIDERHEAEARRIARELHDQAGQLLAAVHLALDGLRPCLAPGGGARLDHALEMLHEAEEQIRRLSHELRPPVLDDFGLVPALRFMGEGVARRTGVAVTVSGPADLRLPPRVENALYRVAQEALNNVGRHARAARANVEVVCTDGEVVCRVRDDGRGFDPEAAPAREEGRGLGLSGIRERIAPLGGTMEIGSRPGAGTELLIRIPLEVAHAHTPVDRG